MTITWVIVEKENGDPETARKFSSLSGGLTHAAELAEIYKDREMNTTISVCTVVEKHNT